MWGQPRVQERMRLHGWTDAHIKALKDATADPVTQAIMGFMQVAYEDIYQKANLIHVREYGMNLARIEGPYAPVRHQWPVRPRHDGHHLGASSGITPSSLKARVGIARSFVRWTLWMSSRAPSQMSHWIHFAPFIRETRGVMTTPTVKRSLESRLGTRTASVTSEATRRHHAGRRGARADVTGTNASD